MTGSGGEVYALGDFSALPTNAGSYVARWNGNGWSAVATGVESYITSLAVSGSDVYVGGEQWDGIPSFRVSKWNGSSWSLPGPGMSIGVSVMAVLGSDLYVGGYSRLAAYPTNCIAKWNGRGLVVARPRIERGGSIPARGQCAGRLGRQRVCGSIFTDQRDYGPFAKWNGTIGPPSVPG